MSTEQNKTIPHRFYALFNTGNLAGYDELYVPDFVDHNPAPGQAPGIEGLKQVLTMFRSGFPDLQVSVDDVIAEGDKVAARVTARGTHNGEFLGIPPTGKQVTIAAIDLYQITSGKIAAAWHIEDLLGLMQQLGVVPAPE